VKTHIRSMATALCCFLLVILLNFLLPRLLPGDPVAYLSGFAEEDMTTAQREFYENALHLHDSLPRQFGYYLRSLLDGTLGYSWKKQDTVAALIRSRLGATLQIALPGVVLSSLLGLVWGLYSGYRRSSRQDRVSTGLLIVLNAVPTFLLGLGLLILFAFRLGWLPYAGLSSGNPAHPFLDRVQHLILPVLTLTLAALPSRYLQMRSTAAELSSRKFVLYARERGLSHRRIRWCYVLRGALPPFLTMVGLSVSLCVGGSLVIENIFSVNGMGKLLTDAVYSLDYPLMQGILFVTTGIMVLSIVITDLLCILLDPQSRQGAQA